VGITVNYDVGMGGCRKGSQCSEQFGILTGHGDCTYD
jgi:hypothetical protein